MIFLFCAYTAPKTQERKGIRFGEAAVIKMPYLPEGRLTHTPENLAAISSHTALCDAMHTGKILEARAVSCDSAHRLHIDLQGKHGLIPREEGAIGIREGTARDIAIISRVGRDVCFTVTDITYDETGEPLYILSRRAAQERCRENYLQHLIPGDILDAKITHLEAFGAFADIGCGIVALLPIDMISVSRITHPRERFCVDMEIKAVIKNRDNGKITLSHKELLGTWEENAARFCVGETVTGTVRSVENYGVFVELAPNLAGLAESHREAAIGRRVSVFIKNILPARMKIKLAIIEVFPEETILPPPPRYFLPAASPAHLSSFCYAPKGCGKGGPVPF